MGQLAVWLCYYRLRFPDSVGPGGRPGGWRRPNCRRRAAWGRAADHRWRVYSQLYYYRRGTKGVTPLRPDCPLTFPVIDRAGCHSGLFRGCAWLMGLSAFNGGLYEGGEQRMGPSRPAFEFWVKLAANHKGMILHLRNFN